MTNGYTVCLPITEQQDFDLVVVQRQEPALKVQVKTTSNVKPSGHFNVQLRTCGGNRTTFASKNFDRCMADVVIITTAAGVSYLIPRNEITATTNLTLNDEWNQWRVG